VFQYGGPQTTAGATTTPKRKARLLTDGLTAPRHWATPPSRVSTDSSDPSKRKFGFGDPTSTTYKLSTRAARRPLVGSALGLRHRANTRTHGARAAQFGARPNLAIPEYRRPDRNAAWVLSRRTARACGPTQINAPRTPCDLHMYAWSCGPAPESLSSADYLCGRRPLRLMLQTPLGECPNADGEGHRQSRACGCRLIVASTGHPKDLPRGDLRP
jgi:hypothetical protein